MTRIINIEHLTISGQTEFLDKLVKDTTGKFKIIINPQHNTLHLVGVEFKTKDLAMEMKMKYF